MTNSEGIATNGLYGFVRSIIKIEKDFKPDYIAIVFDGPRNKASRLAIYEDYKGHREKAPDDLYPQIDLAKKFCEAYNLPIIEVDGVEADDAIGAVAKFAKNQGIESYLCSSDKDLCQLVDSKTFIVHTHKDNQLINHDEVVKKYGIEPKQFIDYLAIVGDSSDNIPGIKGFGPKTATKFLQEYGSLKNLIKCAQDLKNKKQAEKILAEQENAKVSYKLATIDLEVEVPQKLSFYESIPPSDEALMAFYEKVEFKTLLKELVMKSTAPKTPEKSKPQGKYTLINDEMSLKGLVNSLSSQKSLCIDTETTGINPQTAELLGIGLGYKEGVTYYIPLNGAIDAAIIIKELKPLFNGKIAFFGHNIKYDMHILKHVGLDIQSIDFDTLIASYVLDSHLMRHNLDLLTERHFGHIKIAYKDLIPSGRGKTFADVELLDACNYCCEDVDYTIRLKNLFEKEIESKGFESLFYNIELPLLPVLFSMEESGIFIDTEYLKTYSIELKAKIEGLSQKIYKEAGKEFNINSPKQLSEVLFEDLKIPSLKKTKSGHSTGAEILQALKTTHPIIPHILEYRTFEKLRSTYVDALPKEVNQKTHRIHCTFNQSGAVTGRLSSSNPNLQNIPIRGDEGKKVRKAFLPQQKGWVFLSLDYSQIELRILAHMAEEKTLIKAFNNDQDIHTQTAAHVFDVPLDKVTKTMRYKAKAVNFGIIYGQKSFGLAKELGIEIREAKAIIETYFNKYPNIKKFIEEVTKKAHQDKKTVSLLGRERLLPDINSSNFAVKAANERFAVNAPIQGTQADIIKVAMIKIDKKLSELNLKSFMVLQIHDELIFECPEEEVKKCEKLVKEIMENAYSLLVPLKVDVSVGKNWSEC
ncbi:MAG: DNA polymerase I [Chlamydiia bacterium]|nr:DNA polymerase I [Chlamydiia bacterium]